MAKQKNNAPIDFDLSNLSIDDLVEFEEGDARSVRFVRDFMGRFVSDGNGSVLPREDGIKKIGSLPLTDIGMLSSKFSDEVNRMSEAAVNPTNEEDSEPD